QLFRRSAAENVPYHPTEPPKGERTDDGTANVNDYVLHRPHYAYVPEYREEEEHNRQGDHDHIDRIPKTPEPSVVFRACSHDTSSLLCTPRWVMMTTDRLNGQSAKAGPPDAQYHPA